MKTVWARPARRGARESVSGLKLGGFKDLRRVPYFDTNPFSGALMTNLQLLDADGDVRVNFSEGDPEQDGLPHLCVRIQSQVYAMNMYIDQRQAAELAHSLGNWLAGFSGVELLEEVIDHAMSPFKEDVLTSVAFDLEWVKLEELGLVDSLGGSQYRRARCAYCDDPSAEPIHGGEALRGWLIAWSRISNQAPAEVVQEGDTKPCSKCQSRMEVYSQLRGTGQMWVCPSCDSREMIRPRPSSACDVPSVRHTPQT